MASVGKFVLRSEESILKDLLSFINDNTEIAKIVLESDEVVDKLNKEIFKFSVAKMQAEPSLIEPCAHLIVMTRHIERLADHSTNIAENVIFYLDAQIISHMKKLQKHNKD